MLKGFTEERRAVLRVTGADARPLLQDLVTNDLDRLASDGIVYAALLTPQGKYLFDFFLIEAGAAVLIDVAVDRAAALAQRLTMYRLRRDMTIEATETKPTLLWGEGEAPDGALRDPRAPSLGWRLYDAPSAPPSPGSPAEYDALRVEALVPESGAELLENDSYILEHGFERLSGVDFRKGCYVGQEVTARMKHKTELKKGLVRVALDGEAAPGDAITTPEGKPVGALFTIAGGEALAHVRYDRADGEMKAGAATLRRL